MTARAALAGGAPATTPRGPAAAAAARARAPRRPTEDAPLVRALLVAAALAAMGLLVLLPAGVVVVEALRDGAAAWWRAVSDPAARAAVRLTLLVALVAVPLNAAFGLAAAWAVTRFRFPGRGVLLALVDLPLGVSPVISGLVTVLLFGAHGLVGPWLLAHGVRVVFAAPGVVIATVFVTFPYVVRELVPFMEAEGADEEEAALVLGASGWQIFRRVTLPNVRWSLLHGIVLCNARAMGEFGAVSVVSGHVRGLTDTLPLHVEQLYGEFAVQAAFAASSLLFLLALATLVAKRALAWREVNPLRRDSERAP